MPRKNRRRHDISLVRFFEMTNRIIAFDGDHSADEFRWKVTGLINGFVYVAIITYRAGRERPISLRRAESDEEQDSAEAL